MYCVFNRECPLSEVSLYIVDTVGSKCISQNMHHLCDQELIDSKEEKNMYIILLSPHRDNKIQTSSRTILVLVTLADLKRIQSLLLLCIVKIK